MKMFTQSGNSMRDLVEFVNAKKIKKENIVSMGETKDGLFLLIYYSEDE